MNETGIYLPLSDQDYLTTTTDLEVTRMPKLPATVLASESVLVVMDQHVVVETVLARERLGTDETHEWLDAYKQQDREVLELCLK